MQADVIEKVNKAISNSMGQNASDYMVDALRAVEGCSEETRRMAIARIEDHLRLFDGPQNLGRLLVTLRRVG